MTYIFVYFLPGAAGNFLSRALTLLDGSYCFAGAASRLVPKTLPEKMSLLSYDKVANTQHGDRVWTRGFEEDLVHYSQVQEHWKLPAHSKAIFFGHGDFGKKNLAGPDDTVKEIYIDPRGCFEWVIMNAFYKNSVLDVDWFERCRALEQRPDLYKFNLANLVAGTEKFLDEFQALCKHLDLTPNRQEMDSVSQLYQQWRTTMLDYSKINEFKQKIGFYL
jgi:hypothetical protein